MQLLPSELNYLIVELCSDSPSTLTALARTHTSFQREAEKALYDTLSIKPLSDKSLKCMETLSTNPEKAALVRSLTIEYDYGNTIRTRNRRVTTFLSKSLINMHSLSDFRVISFPIEFHGQIIKGLTKILCGNHFQLQTYHCHYVHNISRIIKNQTELQILGLDVTTTLPGRGRITILKTLKKLHNAQLFLPIVFTSAFSFYKIGIFPAFYSVDRRATIPQVMAQFLNDRYQAKQAFGLSIFLIDSSDMPSICALAKGMTVSFSQARIIWLDLWFERQCDIPLQEIQEKFSFFSAFRVKKHVWPEIPEEG